MIVRTLAVRDPVEAVARLKFLPNLTFLDSAMAHPTLGRFSFLAADPFGTFTVERGRARWNGTPIAGAEGGRASLAALKDILARYCQPSMPGLPPFQGGAAGYV